MPVGDLMWLESQIAQRVGAGLDVPMSGKERAALARHMTESFDAYQWSCGDGSLRTTDEPRPAGSARGVRAGHGQRLQLR